MKAKKIERDLQASFRDPAIEVPDITVEMWADLWRAKQGTEPPEIGPRCVPIIEWVHKDGAWVAHAGFIGTLE